MDGIVLMQAKGANGTLELLQDRIRIRRDGWLAGLYGRSHTQCELLVQQIESIEFKSVAGGLAGYIVFHTESDVEACEDLCVSFLKPQQPLFEKICKGIESRRTAVLADHAETHMELLHYDGVLFQTITAPYGSGYTSHGRHA